jgi:hypothetical protein
VAHGPDGRVPKRSLRPKIEAQHTGNGGGCRMGATRAMAAT